MKKIACALIFCFIISFFCMPSFHTTAEEKVEIIVRLSDTAIYSRNSFDPSDYETVYTFDRIMNGYVIKADKSELSKILETPGVSEACISETIMLPELNQNSASASVGSIYANDEVGYNGEGTVVAVIDSELDYNHDALYLSNPGKAKLKKADIAEILENETMNIPYISANRVYKNAKVPFAYDYCEKDTDVWDDTNIHGTHVSGIVSGNNDVIKGIAPESQIIFMKVFRTIAGVSLGTTADVFAAVEDAVKFGVSSINLSLSVEHAFEDSSSYDMFKKIIENVKNMGIVISSSAGNSGRGYLNDPPKATNPDYGITGIPSGFSETLSVGSVNNKTYTAYTITVDEKEIPINESDDSLSFAKSFSSKNYEYVYCGYGDYLSDFANLSGKVALVEASSRPGLFTSAAQKISNALTSGARGVILISKNNSYSTLPEAAIPVCMVSASDGIILKNSSSKLFKSNRELKEVELSQIEVSDFSAWNYTNKLELQVDLTAPGGMIYSSTPDNLYKSYSGTSMSAPQVAGAAALTDSYISDILPNLSGREKVTLSENILMSSATPVKSKNGIYESPLVQGAGLLNLKSAFSIPCVLYANNNKTKINLYDKLSDSFSFSFTKKNFKGISDSYNTLSVYTLTDSSYEENGVSYIGDIKELSNSFSFTETKISDSETRYDLTVNLTPEETAKNKEVFKNGFFISGYVFLTSDNPSEPPLSIPFMGFYGDFRLPPVFDTDGDVFYNGYPASYITENNTKKYVSLGTNTFDGSFHADKMAISPNGDGFNDTIYIYPRFLRNINYLYLMLLKDEYDCPSQTIKTSIPKFSGNSYYNIPVVDRFTGKIIADGKYTIKLSAMLKYDINYKHSTEYPVVFDTKKPSIHSISLTDDKLSVSVSDNHFIQAIVFEAVSLNGEAIKKTLIPENTLENEILNYDFDISQIDENSVVITVYDYGYNKTIARNAKDAKALPFDNQLKLMVSEEYSENIIAASYNNNALLEITNSKEISFEKTGEFIKIFVWDKNNLKPYDDILIYAIY